MKVIMKKRVMSLLLSGMMIGLAGCGKTDGTECTQAQRGEDITMGRYVETETNLPVQMEEVESLYKMSDGKLVILDRQGQFLISEDYGATWTEEDRSWIKEKASSCYVMDIKINAKGIMGIIYVEGEECDVPESMSQASLQGVLLYPDDTVVPLQFSKDGSGEYIDRFWISPEDRFFISTMAGNIYEVQEDGTSRLYLATQGSPQTVQFQGNLMIIDGYEFREPLLYDMEKEAYVEDEVLAGFIKENYAERGFNGAGWQNLYLFPGEEDVIYLAGKNGLHRHVIGGAAMEQIIDGKLSRLGNPQYGIAGMVFLETGEFLAVSDQGKLIRFTFDPDKESVPQERLRIYSLKENVDMHAAVSFYQIQNPDVFVEYEVGMEEGGAVTREDAIKKLNTQIMAGEGPDILILDDLPVDSYMEKGMLRDLKGLVDELGDTVFENLICAFAREDKIYAVPGQVRFPVILGKKEDISELTGLMSLADRVEQMREENPKQDLIGISSEKAIMKLCAIISTQEWKQEDGGIDKEAMAEFLTQAKRIYEAQMNGIQEESRERLQQANESYVQYEGENWMYDLTHYGFYMDYVAGYSHMYLGVSFSPRSYLELSSVSKADGFADTILVSMEREGGSVFIPETILGMNAATQKTELAEDFMQAFWGKDIQHALSGYAVNKAAFEASFLPEEEVGENGEYGSVGILYEDGRELSLDFFVPAKEEIARIRGWMESAKTPYREDAVLEECVIENGAQFVLGERGIEETLDAIEGQLAIYLAE